MPSMPAHVHTANADALPEGLLVAGIDTHKLTHHVAVLDHLGRTVADRQFDTTEAGCAEVTAFLNAHGPVDRVGVEGTGSYGAGIARALTAAGFVVIEVMRQNRQARRLRGKSDPIDARQAALSVLAGADKSIPKSGDGPVESLRILTAERRSAVKARTQAINQIHALLVTAPDPVRTAYRSLSGDKLIAALTRSRPGVMATDPDQVARQSLKRLAVRCSALRAEIAAIDDQLGDLVRKVNPRLLTINGVGVVTATALLSAAGDNPERLTSKAAFAALAGVAPIPASSGQRVRHRLSRGGNRQANHALHRIVLLRMRHHEPRTMAYFTRRRAEGLTDRDIIRCLKRHIANEVYAALIDPVVDDHAGRQLRAIRQRAGIPITTLAATLNVPYQRLRRLEIGIRTDPELTQRATALLTQLEAKIAA